MTGPSTIPSWDNCTAVRAQSGQVVRLKTCEAGFLSVRLFIRLKGATSGGALGRG